ncbi:MAG: hypothetical protein F2825_06195 [Actinobacteria bacterium]|uniref:Hemolysin III family protein n=2 Tax=root TaxID=1 RepID=A0ABU8EEQ0_9ACTN|nr:hemolysin III family protein [Klenkia terrae]MSW64468.1 hypothetical protein [Actinomycetota bacterium]
MTAPPMSAPPALLYDAQRDTHHVRPTWRGWLHLAWSQLALVFGVLLVVAARGPVETTAVLVYVVALVGLLGTSALYHLGTWSPAARRVLQRLDQSMIVVLVAGTATPIALLAVRGTAGYLLLGLVWTCALAAIGLHLVFLQVNEVLMGSVFIGLGVLSALGLPALWDTAGHAAGWLVLGGGALYILGAVGYHLRRPDPRPLVFGYHEVFHALVCAAATCHFLAVSVLLAAR